VVAASQRSVRCIQYKECRNWAAAAAFLFIITSIFLPLFFYQEEWVTVACDKARSRNKGGTPTKAHCFIHSTPNCQVYHCRLLTRSQQRRDKTSTKKRHDLNKEGIHPDFCFVALFCWIPISNMLAMVLVKEQFTNQCHVATDVCHLDRNNSIMNKTERVLFRARAFLKHPFIPNTSFTWPSLGVPDLKLKGYHSHKEKV